MKKIRSLLPLIVFVSFIFSGCEFIEKISDENKNLNFNKTISIEIPDEYDGKECFLIYTNTGEGDSYIGRNVSNCNTNNNQRMTIYKGITNMGGGYYRDEVVFNGNYRDIKSPARYVNTTHEKLTYRKSDNNKFYAFVNDNVNYKETEFINKYDGTHCRLWFYNNNPSIINNNYFTIEEFNILGKLFDEKIYSNEINIFGSNKYNISDEYISGKIIANEDTKIDILIYDIYGDAKEEQQSGAFGFFYSYDFSTSSTSNMCEAIHIDSYFLMKDIEGTFNEYGKKIKTQRIASTIVHEFQHLLNYCNKNTNSENWYNEMLSMCAEEILQDVIGLTDDDSPKVRFTENFNKPYQGFVYWPNSDDPDVLYAYGNAYAFGAYLIRNYGGIELIHQIATNEFVNEDSITKALQSLGKNEDFNSVMKKFGYVYILDERNSLSLNKSVSQRIKNIQYDLKPIDLSKYCYYMYDNLNQIEEDKKNVYGKDDSIIYTNNKGEFVILGPRIYKTTYKLTNPIKQYGFVVYYLGKVYKDKTYVIANPGNNIEYSLVTFD